jgi:hypothetical protein
MNSVHTVTSYVFKINFNIILSSAFMFTKWSLPFRFSNKNFAYISQAFMHAPCPSILLDSIVLIILDEEYKLWESPLNVFEHGAELLVSIFWTLSNILCFFQNHFISSDGSSSSTDERTPLGPFDPASLCLSIDS